MYTFKFKAIICFLFLFSIGLSAMPGQKNMNSTNSAENYIDINSINTNRLFGWFINNGSLFSYQVSGSSGGHWPYEQGGSMVFQSGLWVIGKTSIGEIRSACVQYTSEFLPGVILENGQPADSSLPEFRIFKINAGDTTSEDYLNWPSENGAPLNDEGKPLLLGDQTLWFVCNDASPSVHHLFFTESMGIETQYTIFGVDSITGLEDVVFIRLLILNKGTETYDSTYFGFFNDMDLGDAVDDKSGNDPSLQLAYLYNGKEYDDVFGRHVPAVGFQLLQGPIVESPGDTAKFMGTEVPDHKNLPFTSMLYTSCSSGPDICAQSAQEAFYVLNGLDLSGDPFVNPITGEYTKFLVSGDPLTNTGWIDDSYSDKYQYLGIGPFTFTPGDTQEVIFAYCAGEGVDHLTGIASLREIAELNQQIYDNNFDFENIPVKLYHKPLNYMEDTTPELTITTNDGVSLDLPNSFMYYRIDDGLFTPLSLTELESGVYSANLPEVDCEVQLDYYFEVKDNDGNTYFAPLAAPAVYYQTLWGPDCNPPELRGKMDSSETVYHSDSKVLRGNLNYIDRFPLDSVFFEYRLPGSEWSSADSIFIIAESVPRLDTNITEYAISWTANVSWQNLNYQDEVEYRLAAVDGSLSGNVGYSSSGIIRISHHEEIGNFTGIVTSDPFTYYPWVLDGWVFQELNEAYPWILGVCASENFNDYPDNTDTKFVYGKLFPSGEYSSAFLSYNSLCLANTGDTAFVEISPDSSIWAPVDWITNQLYNSSNTTPKWRTVQLPVGTYDFGYYLRFRFQSDDQSENYPVGWFINRVQLDVDTSAVYLDSGTKPPLKFHLSQNYPNPFNASTVFTYTLPEATNTEIIIYSLDGKCVATLKAGLESAGTHKFIWTPTYLPSGIYLYQIKAGKYSETRKCVILK